MKMHPGLTRITAAAVMSTFVPAVTLTSVFVPTSSAVAAPTKATSNLPTALVQAVTSDGRNFIGQFVVTSFTGDTAKGTLTATGHLSGTIIDPSPTPKAPVPVDQDVTLPVSSIDPPNCSILTLTLGPLDLNLLGLTVHLNQVNLVITAVPGAGNLLGNLLCAVANLLNGGGSLSALLGQIAGLLNQILAAL